MIDGEKYQRISSQFLIEKAFLSGETLLLVITQSDEEAMQNELQKYFSLTLDELVQDEIDREHFESRIQDLSYDIAYPMPIGHGAFLALISSENKPSLSLIQVNKKHALTSAQLLELEKKGRFIPINEKECLLHLASYKEDLALNTIYLVRWRRDQSLGSR